MLQQEVERFKEIAPLILPELLGNAQMGENDLVGDTGLIPYTLNGEYDLEEVMDMLEDQMELTILYHFVPSTNTDFGHQCCAYSDPNFGHMFKIHVVTNGAGKVDGMTVTVFDSLEVMCTNLMEDIDGHAGRGRFLYKRTKQQLLAEFC